MKFYITFGQESPARNGWIELEAPDEITARLFCSENYRYQHWCGTYSEDIWNAENIQQHFPAGKLGGETVSASKLPKKHLDTRFDEPDISQQ